MNLTSAAFAKDAAIPAVHAADGADISPPLSWTGAPAGTRSFALICDDPDAPSPRRPAPEPWVHWVIFNIPADAAGLPAGVERTLAPAQAPAARQGTNSWPRDNVGYRGPAPPPGSGRHRYVFKLYALDATVDAKPPVTKQQLLDAIAGHVLAEATLRGGYER